MEAELAAQRAAQAELERKKVYFLSAVIDNTGRTASTAVDRGNKGARGARKGALDPVQCLLMV